MEDAHPATARVLRAGLTVGLRLPPRSEIWALGAAIVFCVSLPWWYVARERTFYFWDQAAFQDLVVRIARAFGASVPAGARLLATTFDEDYNGLFALPLLPFVWTLGETRVAYEVAIALVYLLPFALAMGSLAVRIVRGPAATVFWSATALTLLTPASWVPGLRGYPDAGGALLMALALRMALDDPRLLKLRTILGVGGLLALAVVFRRHYLFAASALLVTLAFDAALEGVADCRRGWTALTLLLVTAVRLTLVVAAGLATALLVAWPVVLRFWGHNFYGLYRGYLNPPGVVAAFFVEPFGWLTIVTVLLGLALGVKTQTLDTRRMLTAGLFAVVSVLQWSFVARQIGEQYALHFVPFIVLGLTAFGWSVLWPFPRVHRPPVIAAAAFVLGTNLAFGVGDFALVRGQHVLRPLMAANWPPLYRADYDRVAELVAELRRLEGPGRPVLVAASSFVMNPDLLANAEHALYGRSARLEVLNAPAVDSRDPLPMEALLQAQLVVHVTPLQIHLPPGQQQVVAVVHDMFEKGTHVALDFRARKESFGLEDSAVAFLFERHTPTTVERALETLDHFRLRLADLSGSQLDWVVVAQRFPSWVTKEADQSVRIVWHPAADGDGPISAAVYLKELPPAGRVSGRLHFLDTRCPGARLTLFHRAPDGSTADAGEVTRRPGDLEPFALFFTNHRGHRLMLRLSPHPGQASIDYCLLEIDSLVVNGWTVTR